MADVAAVTAALAEANKLQKRHIDELEAKLAKYENKIIKLQKEVAGGEGVSKVKNGQAKKAKKGEADGETQATVMSGKTTTKPAATSDNDEADATKSVRKCGECAKSLDGKVDHTTCREKQKKKREEKAASKK